MEKFYRITDEGAVEFTPEEYKQHEEMTNSMKANEWKFLRASSYPDYREYLDGIVKGDQAQIQAYIDACLAVKAKYPKPE